MELSGSERFLDSDGELLAAYHDLWKAWIPFSFVRRSWPGETLAMMRTFLYLTRIPQKFDIAPPSSGRIPNVDPRLNLPGFGVASITQLRTCVIKIVTFKGGHLMC